MAEQEDDFDYLAHPHGVEMVGPFVDFYKITWKGYRVPYLTANKLTGPTGMTGPEERWHLNCDERFVIECSDAELRRWIWFLAQCMAVAAGCTHFPSERPGNIFNVQMSGLHFEVGPESEA